MPSAGTGSDLDLLRRDAEPEPARTLVLLEILFCDNEQDPEVLDRYFARFEHALRALQQQDVPEDSELMVTIQMSSDKRVWISRTVELLKRSPSSYRTRIRLYEYDHPADGYDGGDMSRIDWVKNPNKHSPYRERLFVDSHQGVNVEKYARVIRVGLDDDDIWMSWQTANICRVAAAARLDPRVEHDGVLAIGMVDTLIGYVKDDGVDIDSVQLKRTLTGEKFHVIDRPESVEQIARYSPIAVPERVELEFHERLKKVGVGLYAAGGYAPGFVYMRWGQNLSKHSKEYLETKKFGRVSVQRPADVSGVEPSDIPRDDRPLWFAVPGETVTLKVSVRRVGDAVHVDSNFRDLPGKGLKACYYLMKGSERLETRWYSTEADATFKKAPPGVTVRAFVRVADGTTVRAQSKAV